MLDHRQSNPLDPHSRREEYPAPSGECNDEAYNLVPYWYCY